MNVWSAMYGLDIPVPSAFMPMWLEMLCYYCLMEESKELYYLPPLIPPFRPNVTFVYMKPIELIFQQGANLFLLYSPNSLLLDKVNVDHMVVPYDSLNFPYRYEFVLIH